MGDLNQRLDGAIQRRDSLQASVQRITGRLESARSTLAQVEDECRERGVEPDELASTIDKLETKYREEVEQIEQGLTEAEKALAPFLKEDTNGDTDSE